MKGIWPGELQKRGPADAVGASLARWARTAGGERLVLLLDGVDGLEADTLFSLFTRLRARFGRRPRGFPRCVVPCGLRDLRNYPLEGSGSFNIVAESLRPGDFSRREIENLLGQRTQETGQGFAPDAVEEIRDATAGQPWLVNALDERSLLRERGRPGPVADDRAGRGGSRAGPIDPRESGPLPADR